MTPGRLILVGSLVLVAALACAYFARVAAGPQDPSCEALFCGGLVSLGLQLVALAVGLYGAVLVGMGLARMQPDEPPPPG